MGRKDRLTDGGTEGQTEDGRTDRNKMICAHSKLKLSAGA